MKGSYSKQTINLEVR